MKNKVKYKPDFDFEVFKRAYEEITGKAMPIKIKPKRKVLQWKS